MSVLRPIYFYSRPDVIAEFAVPCPACEVNHHFFIEELDNHPVWTWNGSWDKPTFLPSMLANRKGAYPDRPLCHSWVTDGQWGFLRDSTHHMAGLTVPMIEVA